jgi:hypothetical protein
MSQEKLHDGRWTSFADRVQQERCQRCRHRGAALASVEGKLLCSICYPDAFAPVPEHLRLEVQKHRTEVEDGLRTNGDL